MSTHEELKAMVDKTFSVHLLPFVATNAPLRELVEYIDDQTEIVIIALLREIDQPTSMEFTGKVPVGWVLEKLCETHGLQLDYHPGCVVLSQALAPIQALTLASVRHLIDPERSDDCMAGLGRN